MSTLLIDIGNTRVKWAVLRRRAPVTPQALVHDGDEAAIAALVRRAPRDVESVVAVSVAGPRFERMLNQAVRARFGFPPELIESTRQAAGVRNGYSQVWRLGADRWVGAIGGFHVARGRDVLVANVGTALTVDLVTGRGRHCGGAIIPGPATMVTSLLSGTHGIRRRAAGLRASTRRLFAADTASALGAGARFAAAAFIDRAMYEATRSLGAPPLLLLSGGGAADLRPLLNSQSRLVPDLVLRGLAACVADR